MKPITRLLLLVAILLVHPSQSRSQSLWKKLQKGDSLMATRYRRNNIDTMYIIRPATKWTVTGRYNVSGAELTMEGRQDGSSFRSEMEADFKSTLSVGVNYQGIALSLALNPAKLMGKYKDYELNLTSYGNRWGFDFIYQDAHNFSGWYDEEGSPRIDLPPDVLSIKSLNVNAYYAFNYRRFSYPAAFSQSYIQRRSAGSFLVGISGQGQKTNTYGEYSSVLKVTNIGLGAGYGYNWVPSRHWLLHISVLPTLTVFSNTSLKVNDERIPLHYHFPEVIIASRAAIVRQFGKMFAGLTTVFNYTNIGDRDHLSFENTKWRSRLLVGYRF